jgi:hypothetical protein
MNIHRALGASNEQPTFSAIEHSRCSFEMVNEIGAALSEQI